MRLFPVSSHSLFAVPLAVAAFALGCGAKTTAPVSPTPSPQSSVTDRIMEIADAIVDDQFQESPETVALLRVPGARYDTLPDDSLAATAARQAREDGWSKELSSIDRAKITEPARRLALDIATETLESRKLARVCRYELWNVRQIGGGVQVRFADLASAQPVATPDERAQALTRAGKIPAYVDTQIANLREGLRLGYAQTDVNVKQVIGQLDRLASTPAESSPFASPGERSGDPTFRAQLVLRVKSDVLPAMAGYRAFLTDEYLPKARHELGVSSNPDGRACYVAAIRATTTLDLTPDAVHQNGLKELAKIEAEMTALAAKSFGGADRKTLLERFAKDPQYLHKDEASLMKQANETIARAKAALPRAFGLLPTADVKVEPIPEFQAKTAAAHYLLAALDGSRPATYRIRLYQPEKQSIVLGESTAFHEAMPGHHLQINIANAQKDNPRIARFLFNSGFGEGWALYAERLADELGLYSDDASRFGMLSNAAWRASRLVIDTGIHAFGWTRDRSIAYLLEHTAISPEQAAQEVDRYISWPGQATAYMTGYLEITRLRHEAERELGPRFDLRAFHDRVLEHGAVPLTVLRGHIEEWIAQKKAG